jgi:hypothetical protein
MENQMNKYVIAYFNSYDGELKQEIVHANSKLEAAFSYLGYEEGDKEGINTLEELYQTVWNMDCMLNILEITGNKRAHSDEPIRAGLND